MSLHQAGSGVLLACLAGRCPLWNAFNLKSFEFSPGLMRHDALLLITDKLSRRSKYGNPTFHHFPGHLIEVLGHDRGCRLVPSGLVNDQEDPHFSVLEQVNLHPHVEDACPCSDSNLWSVGQPYILPTNRA